MDVYLHEMRESGENSRKAFLDNEVGIQTARFRGAD